jgi:hypothetical protein
MGQSYIHAETPYLLQALQRAGKFGRAAPERTLSQTIEKGLVTTVGNRKKRLQLLFRHRGNVPDQECP